MRKMRCIGVLVCFVLPVVYAESNVPKSLAADLRNGSYPRIVATGAFYLRPDEGRIGFRVGALKCSYLELRYDNDRDNRSVIKMRAGYPFFEVNGVKRLLYEMHPSLSVEVAVSGRLFANGVEWPELRQPPIRLSPTRFSTVIVLKVAPGCEYDIVRGFLDVHEPDAIGTYAPFVVAAVLCVAIIGGVTYLLCCCRKRSQSRSRTNRQTAPVPVPPSASAVVPAADSAVAADTRPPN